jgi:hypothetical protein
MKRLDQSSCSIAEVNPSAHVAKEGVRDTEIDGMNESLLYLYEEALQSYRRAADIAAAAQHSISVVNIDIEQGTHA